MIEILAVMKKDIKNRIIGIRISKRLVKLSEEEAKKKGISRSKFLNNLLEEYFLNNDDNEFIETGVDDSEKVRISLRLTEKTAKHINKKIFENRITKSFLMENIIIKFFKSCDF